LQGRQLLADALAVADWLLVQSLAVTAGAVGSFGQQQAEPVVGSVGVRAFLKGRKNQGASIVANASARKNPT